jgi:hypothetical protein
MPAQDYMWHVSRFPTSNATVVAESLQQCVSKRLPEAEHISQQPRTHTFNDLLLSIPSNVHTETITLTVEPTFLFKKT